jgi:hypothetical protein
MQYRMAKDFRDPAYILPRIMDKLLVFTIIATLYLNRAGELTPESVNNVTAMREPPGPLWRRVFCGGLSWSILFIFYLKIDGIHLHVCLVI